MNSQLLAAKNSFRRNFCHIPTFSHIKTNADYLIVYLESEEHKSELPNRTWRGFWIQYIYLTKRTVDQQISNETTPHSYRYTATPSGRVEGEAATIRRYQYLQRYSFDYNPHAVDYNPISPTVFTSAMIDQAMNRLRRATDDAYLAGERLLHDLEFSQIEARIATAPAPRLSYTHPSGDIPLRPTPPAFRGSQYPWRNER